MKENFVKLDWQEPINFAKKIAANYQSEDWVFLYSALHEKVKNSFSYIGLFPKEKIICENFFEAEKLLKSNNKKWLGYLSYEVGSEFEKFPKSQKSVINLPKIWLINFGLILEFNHDKKILRASFSSQKNLDEVLSYKKIKPSKKLNLKVKNIDSNFSDQSYLKSIADIKKRIAAGDFYQTNLTRKFFGEFNKKQNSSQNFDLFAQLTKISPANYCAFLKLDENCIISASPELFLKAKNNQILSRPIKGTVARSTDLEQDKKNKFLLKNSTKERAENLMIVDLVRNDLSRICKAGSITVKKLFCVTSYKNIHHMSSEIGGEITENFFAFDAIRSCFPAGSMTGAPKIKAIEIAAKKEKLQRGVYSGAIGIFSKNEINTSVVIRTLVVKDNKFEFQVGGAITFDSDPESELQEIFNKAEGISKLLQVKFRKIKLSK
ncbi:MAG: hypothetical protein EBS06_06865 [Proteobacteria bacterium]|nr:hypothetical protein [Pseudomonadota bacterium]